MGKWKTTGYQCRAIPYEGKEDYIFISYAHKSANLVLPVLDVLQDYGYRIWFDAGITVGSEWPEYIAEHLCNAKAVIAFVTPEYLESDNCRRERRLAESENKYLLNTVLRPVNMPDRWGAPLFNRDDILHYTREVLLDRLETAEVFRACRDASDGKRRPEEKSLFGRKSFALLLGTALLALLIGGGILLGTLTGNSEEKTDFHHGDTSESAPAAQPDKSAQQLVEEGKAYLSSEWPDFDKALEAFAAAAESGSTDAPELMYLVGIQLQNGEAYKEAMQWYQRASEYGWSEGTMQVGILYQKGLGVLKDYLKARQWYLKAAEQGSTNAMNNIAYLYMYGLGVERDPAAAVEWFTKASEAGNVVATANVGMMYCLEDGLEIDYEKAMEWFLRASDCGSTTAMIFISDFYHLGQGVPQNDEKAFEWAMRAAEAGDAVGMSIVSEFYENGIGVEADAEKAQYWMEAAKAAGFSE